MQTMFDVNEKVLLPVTIKQITIERGDETSYLITFDNAFRKNCEVWINETQLRSMDV